MPQPRASGIRLLPPSQPAEAASLERWSDQFKSRLHPLPVRRTRSRWPRSEGSSNRLLHGRLLGGADSFGEPNKFQQLLMELAPLRLGRLLDGRSDRSVAE